MSANILEAVQGFATPAMIAAATSTLGLDDRQASTALGAAVTSVLGGALQRSTDPTALANIASLTGAVQPDSAMFSNIAGMLAGGVPTSPLQVLGNRFLGQIFGVRQAAAIGALASATGISAKAASGLLTLAAPMALAALRTRLGASPTPAALAGILTADRSLIAQAMPASLRDVYGLAALAQSAAKPAATAPAAAAATPAAPMSAKPAAPAPVAHTSSGHASTTVKTASVANTLPPAAPVSAPAAPPQVAATAAAPVQTAPRAPVQTAHTPVASAETAPEKPSLGIGTFFALLLPILGFSAAVWYWAFAAR